MIDGFSARAATRVLAFTLQLVFHSGHKTGPEAASHRANWSEEAKGERESATKG